MNEMNLTVFDPARAMVADLVKKDGAQELDHTTEAGEKALRSWVYRVKCGKGDIEKTRKATKSDALSFGKKVDALARDLTEPLQEIIDARMKSLNDLEAKRRAEAEAIVEAERVATERAEAERIADIQRREDAIAEKEAAMQAEIDEKERVEREAEIATKAKDEAERVAAEDKERAELEKVEAAERAERDKQEAINKAKADAAAEAQAKEDARLETERLDKIESDRLVQIEIARIANVEHRDLVENEALLAIEKCNGDSLSIIVAIREGKIPHVKIEY